jgi:hypothetical protein
MRRLATSALLVVGLTCLAPAGATAHSTSWYWTPALAESRAQVWYDNNWEVGAFDAFCMGWGKRIRNKDASAGTTAPNRWMYRHFDCTMDLMDGTHEEDTLHVTGRRGFEMYE